MLFRSSLLAVMIYGFFIRNYMVGSAGFILDKMNAIWKYGKLYLFSFVDQKRGVGTVSGSTYTYVYSNEYMKWMQYLTCYFAINL